LGYRQRESCRNSLCSACRAAGLIDSGPQLIMPQPERETRHNLLADEACAFRRNAEKSRSSSFARKQGPSRRILQQRVRRTHRPHEPGTFFARSTPNCRNIADGWLPLRAIVDDQPFGTTDVVRWPFTPSVGSVVIFWCHAGASRSLNLGRHGYKQEFTAVIALSLRLEVRLAYLNSLARMG
jgi:hypothetical protein